MSDAEEDPERDHLSAGLVSTSRIPIVVEDLRTACCSAHSSKVEPSDKEPCMWMHNVMSPDECKFILRAADAHHQSGGKHDTATGIRSQFTSFDPELAALLWTRIHHMCPQRLTAAR